MAARCLRGAVGGREHEFVGIGLIGLAVVLGLAVYLDLAGPLGRGIETLMGWLVGSAGTPADRARRRRRGVPPHGRTASPVQLAIGWSIVSLSALGLLHVRPRARQDLRRRRRGRRCGRLHRCARRRAPRGAPGAGRCRRGAHRRVARRGAARHPHLDSHVRAAHRWVPRRRRRSARAGGQVRHQQHLHAQQRPRGRQQRPMRPTAAPYDVAGEASALVGRAVCTTSLPRATSSASDECGAEAASHAASPGLDAGSQPRAGEP